MSESEVDVIVIGGGPAGEVAAGRIAQRSDMKVALVEGHLLGGECSYYACMPSKALLRPGELMREAHRVPGVREVVSGGLDVEAVLTRRDEVIHGLDDSGQVEWLEERGIELVRGHGRLVGERRVEVEAGGSRTELLAREAVIVATGSGPDAPSIPGLEEAGARSSRELTTAGRPPERLIVLGGGVVGVELAQAWATLGSEVTLIEAEERLLTREEPFAGEQVAAALDGLGVRVLTGTSAEAVARDGERVRLNAGGEVIEGDELLVAIGRRPLTRDIGLETVGLEPGAPVPVDERLAVPELPWLYAVGDATGRSQLTHVGKYQARIAADRITGDGSAFALVDDPRAPRIVFTDPQVAATGMTLEQAEASGIAARAIDLETSGTAGASFVGRGAPGTTRFVVGTERGVLIGATFVGPEVLEMVHAATIAIVGEVPLRTLAHAVPSFPTRSELWLEMIEAYGL